MLGDPVGFDFVFQSILLRSSFLRLGPEEFSPCVSVWERRDSEDDLKEIFR